MRSEELRHRRAAAAHEGDGAPAAMDHQQGDECDRRRRHCRRTERRGDEHCLGGTTLGSEALDEPQQAGAQRGDVRIEERRHERRVARLHLAQVGRQVVELARVEPRGVDEVAPRIAGRQALRHERAVGVRREERRAVDELQVRTDDDHGRQLERRVVHPELVRRVVHRVQADDVGGGARGAAEPADQDVVGVGHHLEPIADADPDRGRDLGREGHLEDGRVLRLAGEGATLPGDRRRLAGWGTAVDVRDPLVDALGETEPDVGRKPARRADDRPVRALGPIRARRDQPAHGLGQLVLQDGQTIRDGIQPIAADERPDLAELDVSLDRLRALNVVEQPFVGDPVEEAWADRREERRNADQQRQQQHRHDLGPVPVQQERRGAHRLSPVPTAARR